MSRNIVFALISFLALQGVVADLSLEQLHIVFRHGNRTPEYPYPTDPNKDYTWPPMGWDHLSMAGMDSTFRLAQFVRKEYDAFLGDVYTVDIVNATSTDSPRAKQCLQLFMAGLYPPLNKTSMNVTQQWQSPGHVGSMWQPFVYHYMPQHLDDFLYMNKVDCPQYEKEFEEVTKSNWTKKVFDLDRQLVKTVFELGKIEPTLKGIENFHCTIRIETFHKLPVPSWVEPFYPDRLMTMGSYHFIQRVFTRSMQKFKAGPLVKHVINTFKENRDGKTQPKLWLYSGHDDTVSALGAALKVWGVLYPDFNAMLVLELLRDTKTNKYFVQVKLRLSHAANLEVKTVPGCTSPCPLDKFSYILKDVIPNDWRKECKLG